MHKCVKMFVVMYMYYEFIADKYLDRNEIKSILDAAIEDEFDFEMYDSYSGYIETGFSISSKLQQLLPIIWEDSGIHVHVLGTPKRDALSRYVLEHLPSFSKPYYSLADALYLCIILKDEKIIEAFKDYFSNIPTDFLDLRQEAVQKVSKGAQGRAHKRNIRDTPCCFATFLIMFFMIFFLSLYVF